MKKHLLGFRADSDFYSLLYCSEIRVGRPDLATETDSDLKEALSESEYAIALQKRQEDASCVVNEGSN